MATHYESANGGASCGHAHRTAKAALICSLRWAGQNELYQEIVEWREGLPYNRSRSAYEEWDSIREAANRIRRRQRA